MITCETCGKLSPGNDIGNHWVCGDCNIEVNTEQTEKEQDEKKLH
ncbi:hypothetical protein [Aneurinibacillus tyrosinisolvens]|jgi:hypothetical protein|nr:hypothetical protein [Aneurinibacillus tyrosinisolvens]